MPLNAGVLSEVETYRYDDVVVGKDQQKASKQLNLSALKGEDSQATLRITTLTLAPEGSHDPTRLVLRRGLTHGD
jgi:hypothetical protein